jgi:DNA-binding transcriptional MerR regulator
MRAYTITEVAALTGLTADTLRWYERIGLLTEVTRDGGGKRRYTARDLRWLDLLVKLRATGMPVTEMVRHAAQVLDVLGEVAQAHGATTGQVALAWVQQRGEVWNLPVVPIPGTKRRRWLEENAAAADLRLSEDQLAALEPLANRVVGERYANMRPTFTAREG